MKYARKCDYTGKGMNTGYVFIDDSCMIDERELFIKELRKDREGIINLIPKDSKDIHGFDNSCYLTEKEYTFDEVWDNIIEYGIANEDELRLVCHINGSKIESLNDVLEVRTSYKDWEQYKSME